MEISKVGVVGCGTMGLGIVQVVAQAGFDVVVVKVTPGPVDKASTALRKTLEKSVERGKMEASVKDQILSRITFTSNLAHLHDCNLVIESVIEDLDTKSEFFRRLEEIVTPQTLLVTNTSTLSVTALMSCCQHRERIAGLHFFNPAPTMQLVEVIHAFETSDQTIKSLDAFCRKLGKDPVLVQDTTGFIVNRLLTPFMLNAIRLLEQGTGTIGDIDKAMMLGAAHPMGPFALADYIGLDVVQAMAQNCYEDSRQPELAVPHSLQRLVQLGYLGRKTGKGFYDYAGKPAQANPDLRRPVS